MEEKRCFTEQVNSKLHHFKLFNISSPLKAFKKCALYYMRGFFFFGKLLWNTCMHMIVFGGKADPAALQKKCFFSHLSLYGILWATWLQILFFPDMILLQNKQVDVD